LVARKFRYQGYGPAFISLLLAGLIAGCGGPATKARVEDQSRHYRYPASAERVVVKGDTLYSIAWETGNDVRDLASWNRIGPDYIIFPGQKLKVREPDAASTRSSKSSRSLAGSSVYKVRKGDTLYSIARRASMSVAELAEINGIKSPYLLKPGQRLKLETSTRPEKSSSRSTKTAARPAQSKNRVKPRASALQQGRISWSWPVDTEVRRSFGSGGIKGLEFRGRKGQTIQAAGAGKVVYQGDGLRGYGNLVIIKHNEDFLSAYAHCDSIVVAEGDMIKKGQKIATIGKTGTNNSKLHFEIRYRGRPVDPLKHLPRR
jgi:lipoprotein NlpD